MRQSILAAYIDQLLNKTTTHFSRISDVRFGLIAWRNPIGVAQCD